MQAMLHGGPYDGIVLDHNDINLYTRFLPVGIRKFVLMPPLKDWDAVRRGDKEKDGPLPACLFRCWLTVLFFLPVSLSPCLLVSLSMPARQRDRKTRPGGRPVGGGE